MGRIYVSDAIDYLRSLPDKSVEGVVTSPPYNIGIDYDASSDNLKDYPTWTALWVKEAVRVAKRGAMINISAKASDWNQLFAVFGKLAETVKIQNILFWVKSIYVGEKTYGHFKPINSPAYVNNTVEFIVHAVDSKVEIDKLAVGVPFEYKQNIERFASNGGDLRCRGSAWFIPYKTRQVKLDHPATYPVELAEYMIKLLGGGGKIVDPFMGSGTTAIAAINLGRDFEGSDISDKYVFDAGMRVLGRLIE